MLPVAPGYAIRARLVRSKARPPLGSLNTTWVGRAANTRSMLGRIRSGYAAGGDAHKILRYSSCVPREDFQ
jgi:hypothetical protein